MADAEDLEDFLGIPRKLIPWFPSIDDDLCSNCGLCVEACKHQTYAFTDPEKVVVADPYKDALAAVGADFDKQVVALDLRNMPTEEAMQKVAAAFEKFSQARG